MIRCIHFFLPPRSQYQVLHAFTREFSEAFERQGIRCKILEAEKTNPKPFLEAIFKDKPDFTLSFNGLLPDEQGRFLCDLIKIPHISCLVDAPYQFLSLTQTPLSMITCVDRFSVDFFRGINFPRVMFMPHAIDRALAPKPGVQKTYDVVMLATCLDYEANHATWKGRYGDSLAKIMEEGAEVSLKDTNQSLLQCFVQALDGALTRGDAIDPSTINFVAILDDLEQFVTGKARVEVLKGIKEAHVHVFGASIGQKDWKAYLGDQKNITIHEPVSYPEALDVIQKSKVLINSCAKIKNGAHERVFAGMALGAAVMSENQIFIRENFKDGEDLVLYRYDGLDALNEQVELLLADESKRAAMTQKAMEAVKKHHTWDHRAQQLIKEVEPMLKDLRSVGAL